MKKLLVGTILAVIMASAAFASGVPEAAGPWNSEDATRVTLQGNLQLEEGLPVLVTSDGTRYDLMVPGYRWYEGEVTEGAAITVTGYEFTPGPRAVRDELDKHFRAEQVVYNGTTYDLTTVQTPGRFSGRTAYANAPQFNQPGPNGYRPGMNSAGMYGRGAAGPGRPGMGRAADQNWGPRGRRF